MTANEKAGTASPAEKIRAFAARIVKLSRMIVPGRAHKAPGRLPRWLVLARFCFVTGKKFMDDDCMTKASSIAYTSIVSLVPTLTVILTVYSVFSGVGDQKEEFFSKISLFMLDHNIRINIDPVFAAISGLIDNAGKIGVIGSVIMIFSATAMLRSLEKSINDVWKIRAQRPIFLKVIYYWSALTLGPILIIAGATAATTVQQAFSSPNYEAVAMTGKDVWVAGNKNKIMKGDITTLALEDIPLETVDFDNQKVYRYDTASRSLVLTEERIDAIQFKKHRFLDIQFAGSDGWIIGDRGIVLLTGNGGETWRLRKIGDFNLNDILMLDRDRGFVAAESGVIYATSDGGSTWQARAIEGATSNFNSLAFSGQTGIAAGNRGTALLTRDGGATWELRQISVARRGNILTDLKCAQFTGGGVLWITGEKGVILKSPDGGNSWESRSFMQENYSVVHFTSEKEGFVAGGGGMVLRTENGGESWKKFRIPTDMVNALHFSKGHILAAGKNGLIMVSRDNGATWDGMAGKPFLAILLNFFAPFLFIWTLFLFIYIVLPNTKVPFRYGALGATFTAAVWVAFILFFIVYIKAFASGTFAIYGALVSIPFFLLLVYTSVLIVLLGAEVSYVLMHPAEFLSPGAADDGGDIGIYDGVALLAALYGKFESGGGPSDYRELAKAAGGNDGLAARLLERFREAGFLIPAENGGYLPSNSSRNIRIMDVMDSLNAAPYAIPGGERKSGIRKFMGGLFDKIRAEQKKIVGETTIADVIAHQ